jgi:hypothetical protein
LNQRVSPLIIVIGVICGWLFLLEPFIRVPVLHLGCKAVPVFLMASALSDLPDRSAKIMSVGFMLAAFGDIFTSAPGDLFFVGMSLHLVAWTCYAAAFTELVRVVALPWLLPFIAWASSVAYMLLPYVMAGQAGVALYAGASMVLMWRATVYALHTELPRPLLALGGALLLGLSDTLIASVYFVGDFPVSRLLVMSTYWGGQTMLCAAVWSACVLPRRRGTL